MPHTLTETSVFDPAVTVPDDGDGLNSQTTFVRPHQALVNRHKYLYDRIPKAYVFSIGTPYGEVGGARGGGESVAAGAYSATNKLIVAAGHPTGSVLLVGANISVLAPTSLGNNVVSAYYLYDIIGGSEVGNIEPIVYTVTGAAPEARSASFVTWHIVTAAQEAWGMDIRIMNAANSTDTIVIEQPTSMCAFALRS